MKRKILIIIGAVLVILLFIYIQKEGKKEEEGVIKNYHKAAIIEKSTENGIEYFFMLNDLVYERFSAIELEKDRKLPMDHWKYKIFIPDAIETDENGKYIAVSNGTTSVITMYDDLIEIDGIVYKNDPKFELTEWIEFFYDYHSKNYEIYYIEDN